MTGDPNELRRYYRNNDQPPSGLVEEAESRYHWFVDHFVHRIPDRRQQPFMTHLPVLVALGDHLQVKRVLELGCGKYSTLTFLDRDCFPYLEKLDSVENDPAWGGAVRDSAQGDDRLCMRVVAAPVASVLAGLDLDSYDLVFVDDSLTTADRSRTIAGLTNVKRPVVVIHDYDIPAYRFAASRFLNRFRFTALNPNTGIVWNAAALRRTFLAKVNTIVREHYDEVPLDDAASFQDWLKSTFKALLLAH
jgi:hypothetical protein